MGDAFVNTTTLILGILPMTFRKVIGAVAGLVGFGWIGVANAAPVTLNFDDGTENAFAGSMYSGLGVTFANAQFTPNFGLPGSSGPLGIKATESFIFNAGNPIIATFSTLVRAVSVVGVDVGAAGMTIQAFDAANNLIDSDTVFGIDVGIDQFFTLSVTGDNIASVRMFQPFGGGDVIEGALLDDFTFDPVEVVDAVPEPASIMLLGAGIAALGVHRRRRKNAR